MTWSSLRGRRGNVIKDVVVKAYWLRWGHHDMVFGDMIIEAYSSWYRVDGRKVINETKVVDGREIVGSREVIEVVDGTEVVHNREVVEGREVVASREVIEVVSGREEGDGPLLLFRRVLSVPSVPP
ncbi:hypothetical protein YC2023_081172 [Brassica napus]